MTNQEYVDKFNEGDMPKRVEIWNYFAENHNLTLLDGDIDDIEKLFDKFKPIEKTGKPFKARGKFDLEVNFANDNTAFLNYWDWRNGKDVCVKITNGVIRWTDFETDNIAKEISLLDFLFRISELVKDQ